MKAHNLSTKSSRNKELNSSRLATSTFDNSELENKMKKLEAALTKITTQNEALTKRIDDLEARNSKQFKKSSSYKSFSTLNNTFTDTEIIDDFTPQKNTSDVKYIEKSFITTELIEWKKDIEKSLESVSERVAANNSNVLVTLLEKRINDMNSEFSKLKKAFDDCVDNTNIIKRNVEKFDRTEKLISGLLTQMSEMRINNVKWQADFLKNLNDFNEKMLMQESTIEELERFENKVNKKMEHLYSDFKNLQSDFKSKTQDIENKFSEKTIAINEGYEYMFNENNRLNNTLKDELQKIEVHNKALWDSFALFSYTIENKH